MHAFVRFVGAFWASPYVFPEIQVMKVKLPTIKVAPTNWTVVRLCDKTSKANNAVQTGSVLNANAASVSVTLL